VKDGPEEVTEEQQTHIDMVEDLIRLLDCFYIFTQSGTFFESCVLPSLTDTLFTALVDLITLAVCSMFKVMSKTVDDLPELITLMNDLGIISAHAALTASIEQYMTQDPSKITEGYMERLYAHVINACTSMWRYAYSREELVQLGFLPLLLTGLILIPSVEESSLVALTACCAHVGDDGANETRKALLDPQSSAIAIGSIINRAIYNLKQHQSVFHAAHLLSTLCNYSDDDDYIWDVCMNAYDRTEQMEMTRDRRELHNYSPSFESIRATHCTHNYGKYVYEVKILSKEIVQVGWALRIADFDAEHGNGVGDEAFSYSIDGHRCKKWHVSSDDYGMPWRVGDVVGAAIDLDEGQISYYLNGEPMGIAFDDIPLKEFYPAISLSTGQSCRVRFGGPCDRLEYVYPEFEPFVSVNEDSNTHVSRDDMEDSTDQLNAVHSEKSPLITSAFPLIPDVAAPVSPLVQSPIVTSDAYYRIQLQPPLPLLGPPVFGLSDISGKYILAAALLVEHHQCVLMVIKHDKADVAYFQTQLEDELAQSNRDGILLLMKLSGIAFPAGAWLSFGFDWHGRLRLALNDEPLLDGEDHEHIREYCERLFGQEHTADAVFRYPVVHNCPRARMVFSANNEAINEAASGSEET
jgi:hypothetical protein